MPHKILKAGRHQFTVRKRGKEVKQEKEEGLKKSPVQDKTITVEEFGQEIKERVDKLILGGRKQWPVKSNRASQLGHPCVRYLVLLRKNWREAPLPPLALLKRFREGNLHEKAVMDDLSGAGIRVVEQWRGFEWKEYNITGSIDGKGVADGQVFPLEVKSATEFSFKSINTIEDMKNHKWLFMRKYPAQLSLYLLMDNQESGLFIFKNKSDGDLKPIPLHLDYALGETLIQRAEKVNLHIAQDTPTSEIEMIDYEDMICGECDFVHLCLPDVKREAIKIEDDPELIEKLVRWDELKASYAEYQALDKEVKAKVKSVERAVCGDFLITGQMVQKKGFTVEPSEYWKAKIQKLPGGERGGK